MQFLTQADYNRKARGTPIPWAWYMADTNKLGPRAEDFAWGLLKKRGDKLVARNFTCPQGELDLVTWAGDTLVFTEVRARSSSAFGSPAETVTRGKQEKLKRAANWFCVQTFRGKPLPSCRFDVVWIAAKDGAIVDSGIIEGAFC
ncbi:MAG: YraN family protein [Planctomycetota bacterium]|nr:YraN family protein [Planctomycetota bacterium]